METLLFNRVLNMGIGIERNGHKYLFNTKTYLLTTGDFLWGDPQPSPLVSILNHGPWRLDDNWGYHEKTETSIWNSLTMCDTRWIIDSPVPKYDLVYFFILSPNMMVDVLISCLKMTTFSWANAPTESNIPEKHRLFYDLDPSDRKLFEKHSLDRGDWPRTTGLMA